MSIVAELYRNISELSLVKKIFLFSFCLVLISLSFYKFIDTPPINFPLNTVITIEEGRSLNEISNDLTKKNVIKAPLLFRSTVIALGGERKVIAGDYLLNRKEGSFNMAIRFVNGNFNTETIKVTIPEGWNNFEIARHLKSNLYDFDDEEFLKLSANLEGYLFPDTYFLSKNARPKTVVKIMNDNFHEKIKTIPGIATTTKKLKDIIILASILEGEANDTLNRIIVSGILWKRLSLDIPLQVDATFKYINGKNSSELTYDDLKIDSLYNTYKYKGLPPTPINNPGIDSIFSALNPSKTKYLYFLTGNDGKMYYAITFEQHKLNKFKHLK